MAPVKTIRTAKIEYAWGRLARAAPGTLAPFYASPTPQPFPVNPRIPATRLSLHFVDSPRTPRARTSSWFPPVAEPQATQSCPCAVKSGEYRDKAPLTESEGIVAFCGREKVKSAYWVTQGEEDFGIQHFKDVETGFLRIPAHIFVYLPGQAERPLWKVSAGDVQPELCSKRVAFEDGRQARNSSSCPKPKPLSPSGRHFPGARRSQILFRSANLP